MNKIETKHHEPMVYRLYDYLKNNHLGRENGIKKPALAQVLGISERELRKLTKAINESNELEKLVSTTHSCYMCTTKEECEKSIRNTYRVAVALFKKAKSMEKKVGLNGQIKLKLGKYYKDVVETFSEEEE
jgi:AraC-like DNA-binding protein